MNCQHCNSTFPDEHQKFCGTCGTPRNGRATRVGDDDLALKIRTIFNEELAQRVKDPQAVELDIASKAFSRLRSWLTPLFVIVTLIGVTFAVFGFKEFQDFKDLSVQKKKSIVADAKRITQMREQAEQQFQLGTSELGFLKAELERIDAGQRAIVLQLRDADVTRDLTKFHTYLYALGFVDTKKITVRGNIEKSVGPAGDKTQRDVIYFDAKSGTLEFSSLVALEPDIGFIKYGEYALSTSMRKKMMQHKIDVAQLLRNETTKNALVTMDAIGKGLAFYFAASFKNDSDISLGSQITMKLNNPLQFNPNGKVGNFDAPAIWGGMFWNLRETLNAGVADTLLSQTWIQLRAEELTTMNNDAFGRKILDVGRKLVTESSLSQITQTIKKRGIQI